jgi:hypothetical protein
MSQGLLEGDDGEQRINSYDSFPTGVAQAVQQVGKLMMIVNAATRMFRISFEQLQAKIAEPALLKIDDPGGEQGLVPPLAKNPASDLESLEYGGAAYGGENRLVELAIVAVEYEVGFHMRGHPSG